MKKPKRHKPAESGAVERLRNVGASESESGAEPERQTISELIDTESEGENIALRLRIVKPET